jgi:hypothetical protein
VELEEEVEGAAEGEGQVPHDNVAEAREVEEDLEWTLAFRLRQ